MITGAGFALLLAGVSLLTGLPITPKNGLIWGICGFLAATVAPGAGLAPELPGMPAGDLVLRQVWWVATIIATGAGDIPDCHQARTHLAGRRGGSHRPAPHHWRAPAADP